MINEGRDEIAAAVATLGDDPRLRTILDSVCSLTGMGFAAIAYVSDDRWIACQVDDRIDFGLDPGKELEVRKTICDEIRDCGRGIVIEDVGNDPDWWTHPVPILYGFKSYLSLPLTLDDGRFFGTLCAIDPEPRAVSLSDLLSKIENLATDAANLLDQRLNELGLHGTIPIDRASTQP